MSDDSGQAEVRRGRVKWFNSEKGFGFITPADGGPDVFVHLSAYQGQDFGSLAEGDVVEFEVGPSPKGPQAVAVRIGEGLIRPDSGPPKIRRVAGPRMASGSAGHPELHAAHALGGQRIFQSMLSLLPDGASSSLPISIYLASEANSSEVELALVDVLDEFGVDITESMPPIIGSWLGLRLGRLRRSGFAKEVAAHLERAITVQILDQPQAEVDAKQAEALARLMTALEKQDNACIQVGSLFLIKVDGTLVARNLSPVEMSFLSRHPSVMGSPRQVLMALEEFARKAQPEALPVADERVALPRPGPTPREP